MFVSLWSFEKIVPLPKYHHNFWIEQGWNRILNSRSLCFIHLTTYLFIAAMALRSFSCRNWSKACSASLSSLSILWSAISSSRNSVSSRFFSVRFTVREYWKENGFRIYLKPYMYIFILHWLKFKFFNTDSDYI